MDLPQKMLFSITIKTTFAAGLLFLLIFYGTIIKKIYMLVLFFMYTTKICYAIYGNKKYRISAMLTENKEGHLYSYLL